MKNILHILPMNKMSGAEKVALLICKNLKENNPIVVCGGDELAKIFIENGIEAYALEFAMSKTIKTIFKIKKIICEKNIDIIHAHDNIASIIALFTKSLSRKTVKIVSHIHSCYPWLKTNGIHKKLDELFRPKYDLNIVCGKLVYDFYKENAKYFVAKKYRIYSNVIDVENISLLRKKGIKNEIIKENLNGEIIIGFVGRLDIEKGLVPFIKALAVEQEKFKDCKFLIVGSGYQEEEIKSLVKELNLEIFFVFLGFQKEVYKIYPIIDIFFLPSLYEGLPLVILEAMAFEKCVISMNVGSLGEVIENNKNGVLIENNELNLFLEELYKLKNSKKIRNKLGENAFKTIKEKYSISEYNKQLEILYKEI